MVNKYFKENLIIQKWINSNYTGIWISIIYFFAISSISFSSHKNLTYGAETDFLWVYVPAAKNFLHGFLTIDPFRGPIYPIILGLVNLIFNDFFHSGIFISNISSSLVLFFTFSLIKEIFGARFALVVTLFILINPIFTQYSYTASSDMFFNAIASGSLLILIKRKFNYKNIIIIGFLGGILFLTRSNGVFILAFILILFFQNSYAVKLKEKIIMSLIFVSTFLITYCPWGIYCLNEKGDFFYNKNYLNTAFEVYNKGSINREEFGFNNKEYYSLTDVITKNPFLFFKTVTYNVYDNFKEDMEHLVGWQLGFLTMLGIILTVFYKPTIMESRYYVLNISFFFILLFIFYSERFSLFLIPFYTIFAIKTLYGNNKSLINFWSKELIAFIILFLFVWTFVGNLTYNKEMLLNYPREELKMKELFKKKFNEKFNGKSIASRKPYIAYHLNMDFISLPFSDSYSEFIKKLKDAKIDFLYFGGYEASARPKLKFLLNKNQKLTGLQPILWLNDPPTVLYKIIPDSIR
jgi:4-amino-4-deoxy-L-arabinose transferase-like glycosyltransferase